MPHVLCKPQESLNVHHTATPHHAVQAEADASPLFKSVGFKRPEKLMPSQRLLCRSRPPPQYVCCTYFTTDALTSRSAPNNPNTSRSSWHPACWLVRQPLPLGHQYLVADQEPRWCACRCERETPAGSVVSSHSLFTGLKQPSVRVGAAYVGLSPALASGHSSSDLEQIATLMHHVRSLCKPNGDSGLV
jgi:hypothetical protein